MSLKFATILSLLYQTTFSAEGDSEAESDNSSSGCETAFGYSSNDNSLCFLDDDANEFSRWGWTIGPLTFIEGEYDDTFDLYAGAAQCDFENKGYHAGTVEVTINSDGTFSAHFMGDDPWSFSEFHIYIGTTEYPIDNKGSATVAPGSFPFKLELDESSNDYTLSDSIGDDFDSDNNDYYIIVHAVACNDGETPVTSDDDDDTTQTPEEEVETTQAAIETTQGVVETTSSSDDGCTADDYYIELSNGWVSADISLDGTYHYDSDSKSFYRDSNPSGESAVIYFDVVDGDYWLVIGDENNQMSLISYTLPVSEWSDDTNPLWDSSNEANWEGINDETLVFTTGDMTLFDCNDVDLGDEICGLENVSVLPSVYDCSSEGGNPVNYSNAMKNNEISMAVFWTALAAVMAWYY